MSHLRNKTVIITGASRGIGAATATHFAKLGARLVLSARSKDKINALARDIRKNGGDAIGVPCDISNLLDVQSMVQTCTETYGAPDVLINNAGMLDPVERIEHADSAAWERVIDVNIKGVFYAVRECLPLMKSNGGGTIISLGSGAATSALEGWSAYCTSKAAVHHFHACLHLEEFRNNIRSYILSPGTVATNMQIVIRDSGVNPVSQIPWDDHIPPEWVAICLAWMASPDADAHLGEVVSLRDPELRVLLGLQ